MRQIDLEAPLSAEQRDYLLSRGLETQVYVNDAQFGRPGERGSGDTEESVHGDESVIAAEQADWVESLTVEELRDELAERDLPKTGNKPDLQDRLLAAIAYE